MGNPGAFRSNEVGVARQIRICSNPLDPWDVLEEIGIRRERHLVRRLSTQRDEAFLEGATRVKNRAREELPRERTGNGEREKHGCNS